jgi:hypothetical protein
MGQFIKLLPPDKPKLMRGINLSTTRLLETQDKQEKG